MSGLYGAVDDVTAFHVAAKLPVRSMGPSFTKEELAVTSSVFVEEMCEALEALYGLALPEVRAALTALGPPTGWHLDAPALTKELVDVVFSAISVGLFLGLPLGAAWSLVETSNRAKVGPGGQVHRRPDGKVMKPPGWTPPAIEPLLREYRLGIDSPVRRELFCPKCETKHVDQGEWAATRWHTRHECAVCGHDWKPEFFFTVGVE